MSSEVGSPIALGTGGALSYPAVGGARAVLVLAHGAGAGQGHPFMVAVARGLSARGVAVVTFDFPYMRARRGAPDKAPVLEACFEEVVAAAREWMPDVPLFIGGKSLGGRMATHLAARQVEGVSAVVALGYPLHPPGKPAQLRTAHLPAITMPVMIVQGERDTFGTPAELTPVVETMRAPVTLHVVARGDHSLTVRGQSRDESLAPVLDVIREWAAAVGGSARR